LFSVGALCFTDCYFDFFPALRRGRPKSPHTAHETKAAAAISAEKQEKQPHPEFCGESVCPFLGLLEEAGCDERGERFAPRPSSLKKIRVVKDDKLLIYLVLSVDFSVVVPILHKTPPWR
jgi:hypothetical protein